MKSNRITLGLCALISAFAFGCSGSDILAPDPSTGDPETGFAADAGQLPAPVASDLGQDQEAYTIGAGAVNALQPSLFNSPYYDDSFQPYLHQCGTGNGATGIPGCSGRLLISGTARFFTISTNSGDFQSRLQQFCTQFGAKMGGGSGCSVGLFTGATCPSTSLCIRNTAGTTNGGSRPVFDLRRYQQGGCVNQDVGRTTTFRGVTYQVSRCLQMNVNVDKAAMAAEAGSAYASLANDVLFSIGLQVSGTGMSLINSDTANSATFSVGSIPYLARSHFMTNGQICRTNAFQGTPTTSVNFNDAAGCGND